MKTYGYIRVNSDKQTVENQRFEINNFCNKQKISVDGWIEETISGTKSYNSNVFWEMKTLIRVREALHTLTQSIAETTGQFDTIAYEFRFIRDHFPMRVHNYPPRKSNRTRKKQRLSRLARCRQRQQRTR